MKKLSDILPKVIASRELDSNAGASQVLHSAEEYLLNIFGEKNVGKGKNIAGKKLQQGLLFFDVASSGWNNRLFLEKMELLEYLQKEFPGITLKDIRGVVRGGESL